MARRDTLWVLALMVGCGGTAKQGPELELGKPGRSATGVEMTLPRVGGGKVSVSDLRGSPVVITLFTTWCLRCQAEASRFVQLHAREDLKVLGVALDTTGLTVIRTYVDFVGFRFPVLLARPDDLELVGGLGATKQVPRTVLLDRKGRIVLDQVGQTDFAELDAAIKALSPRQPKASPKKPKARPR